MISVAILALNCNQYLKRTYEVLAGKFETVLIDNGSTDGTDKDVPIWVKYVRNNKNLGISKGKNQCVRETQGQRILLLDGDIVPVPGSIEELNKWMDETGELAIGFLPNRGAPNESICERDCHRLFNVHKHNSHCIYYGLLDRDVFQCCEFDEDFGPGYGWEDFDFYEQMKTCGIDQYAAEINKAGGRYYHDFNSSIRTMGREEYIKSSKERRLRFIKKWH